MSLTMSAGARLRALMAQSHCLVTPGCYDALSARLAEQARSLSEELLASGVLEALAEPDEHGRTLRLAPALQADFALNQPLASFAQAAFELIDPEAETYALDVLSVVESILDDPKPVLMAQAFKERGEAVAEMKAEAPTYAAKQQLTRREGGDQASSLSGATCSAAHAGETLKRDQAGVTSDDERPVKRPKTAGTRTGAPHSVEPQSPS